MAEGHNHKKQQKCVGTNEGDIVPDVARAAVNGIIVHMSTLLQHLQEIQELVAVQPDLVEINRLHAMTAVVSQIVVHMANALKDLQQLQRLGGQLAKTATTQWCGVGKLTLSGQE